MKKVSHSTVLAVISSLFPIVLSICFWSKLPEKVATSFAFDGTASGYSSKAFAVFGLPAIFVLATLLVCIGMEYDPKRQGIPAPIKKGLKFLLPIIAIFSQVSIISFALGFDINISLVVSLFIGILFAVIGIYVPKVKQNYTVGIRLPWTLHSEENWNKTHSFAGKIWLAGGLIMIVTSFFKLYIAYFALILIMVILPMLYSFMLYKKTL